MIAWRLNSGGQLLSSFWALPTRTTPCWQPCQRPHTCSRLRRLQRLRQWGLAHGHLGMGLKMGHHNGETVDGQDPQAVMAVTLSVTGGTAADVQLVQSCANLAYVICCLSPGARRWLTAADGGAPLLWQLLLLLMHPLITVRRAIARLAAAVVFGEEADKHGGWRLACHTHLHASPSAAPSGPSATPMPGANSSAAALSGKERGSVLLRLPEAFAAAYLMPCKVTWLQIKAHDTSDTVGGTGRTAQAPSKLQGLSFQQRYLTRTLVAQRHLLARAQGSPARLLQLLDREAEAEDDGQEESGAALDRQGSGSGSGSGGKHLVQGLGEAAAQACAANVRSLALSLSANNAAAALSAASSHGQAAEALQRAAALAASSEGAAALALCPGWLDALAPLLATAPATAQDRELWAEVLRVSLRTLVSACGNSGLGAGSAGAVGLQDSYFERFARYLAQSSLPLLSAPGAAKAPKPLPLALAGSAAAGQGDDAGAGPAAQQQVVQLTQLLLQLLAGFARCCRLVLTAQGCLQTLGLLGLPALVHTLSDGYIAQASASYGCRVNALALLAELLHCLGAGHLLAKPQDLSGELQEALSRCLVAIITHVCHPAYGSEPAEQPWAYAERGCRGSALLRLGLECLQLLCSSGLVAQERWAAAWAQVDEQGASWLQQLSHESDAALRCRAWSLTALLASSTELGAGHILERGWPGAPAAAAAVVVDAPECYAVRSAALRFLSCVLGRQAADDDEDGGARLGRLAPLHPHLLLMQQQQLWQQLLPLARQEGAAQGFIAAVLATVLQGLLLDEDLFAGFLLHQPGNMQWLLQRLASSAGAWQSGDCGDPGALTHAAVRLLPTVASLGLGYTHAAAEAPAGGTAASVPPSEQSSSTLTVQRQLLASFPGPTDADALDLCGGLQLSPQPAASPDKAQATADALERLATCSLASQILGILVARGEPPALSPDQYGRFTHPASPQLPGLSVTQVAVEILYSLCALLALEPLGGRPIGNGGGGGGGGGGFGWTKAGLVIDRQRLSAVHEAASTCNAALQHMTREVLLEVATVVRSRLASSHLTPLATILASALAAKEVPLSSKTLIACLVATLLSEGRLASQLLEDGSTGQEHRATAHDNSTSGGSNSSNTSVGALLCHALIELLPADALTIACDSDGRPVVPPMAAEPASVAACIVALRNTLAYSAGAKAEALATGLHTSLLHCCNVACTLLAAAQQRAGAGRTPAPGSSSDAGGAGSGSAGGDACGVSRTHQHASAFSSPHRPPHGPDGRATPAGFAGLRRKLPLPPATGGSGFVTPAGRGTGQAPWRDHGAAVSAGRAMGSAAHAGQGDRPVPAFSAVHATATPGARQQSASRGVGVQTQARAAGGLPRPLLQALDQRVAVCLSLLKLLAYDSAPSRQALVQAGVVEAARKLWRLLFAQAGAAPGASASGGPGRPQSAFEGSPGRRSVHSSTPPALPAASAGLHELLGLLTNLVVGCPEAKAGLAEAGTLSHSGSAPSAASAQTPLLHSLAELLFQAQLEHSTNNLLAGLFAHLSATEDGTHLLLKLQGLQSRQLQRQGQQQQQEEQGHGQQQGKQQQQHMDFLGSCLRLLRDWAAAGRGRDAPTARHHGILQVLINMAAFREGQRALLQPPIAHSILELLVGVIDPPDGAPRSSPQDCEQALMLLRNLCFAPEAKAHLLAHPALLPALLMHVERAAEGPKAAAAASSALWVLMYHGEKVKAALRRLGSTQERLTVAKATCEFQIHKATQAAARAEPQGQPGSGAAGTADPGRLHWLQYTLQNVSMLLDAFSATAAPASPAKAPRARAGPGVVPVLADARGFA